MRTSEQRRAYIDTSRRTQPIEDLLRKAKKANRRGWRRTYAGVEGADLSLARWWRFDLTEKPHFADTFRVTFCSLCSSFSPIGEPVQHNPRCCANPIDDGPYPGWAAAGVECSAEGRKPDRASAGQAAPPEGQPPAGGETAREAS